MRVAGVSIEDSLLRISVIDKKFGIIKTLGSEEIKLPQPEQERLAVIKDAFQALKGKYKTGDIVIGLGFSRFAHHIIEMPLLSRPDMRNALFYEMEKYLPLPPEEYTFDFISIEKGNNKTKVLVLSARKDRMSPILAAARDSGLNLLAIRCYFIEALAEFIKSAREKNAIFMHKAENAYHIAVLRDNKPVLFKTVSKNEDIISELEELSGSFNAGIYVIGVHDPAGLSRVNAKAVSISLSGSVALSSLRRSAFEMNFIPPEFLPRKKDYYSYAIGAMAISALLLFFFNEVFSYYRDYSALKDIEKKTEQIKSKTSGFLEERKKIESVYEKKKFLDDFQTRRSLNIKVLSELSRVLPKDSWLASMSVDEKGKIEIEGFARRAANIIEPLSKTKLFKKIEFAAPVMSQESGEKFSIRMELAD